MNNKTLQLRFVLKNKDLKSKVRRIDLKWILLNQLKWILAELFRIFQGQYKPTQLYLRGGLLSSAQASFFLICVGDSMGVSYRSLILPRPVRNYLGLHKYSDIYHIQNFQKHYHESNVIKIWIWQGKIYQTN